MMGASLFPEVVTRKLLHYYQSRQQTDSSVLTWRFCSFGRTVVGTRGALGVEVCLVSGEHCFVYHKMRNKMCFTSFSKTATKTWPCPCVCGWRETSHDANRVSENGPTIKSPLSNGSHQCILDLKMHQCTTIKMAKYGPKIAMAARLCLLVPLI